MSTSPSSDARPTGEESNEFRQARLNKLESLREKGLNPFPYRFEKTHEAQEVHSAYAHLKEGEETQDQVRLAGRIMAMRNTGMFIDLHDTTGKIQIFSHKSVMAEENLEILKLLDLGDIIGVTGLVRRTPRGEITINAQTVEVLSKALLPLPEKYHGLTDVETRYRQRYLDLIMNPDSRETLRKRSLIVSEIRTYLQSQKFLEVETPMLQAIAGGAAAKPFMTHHNALDFDLQLRIAPELYLKRLIIGGLSERVFEVGRCFRNEGISPRHNPEFTTVELYQAYADYEDMIRLTESLVEHVARTVFGTTTFTFGEHEIEFKAPWPRRPMLSLVEEVTGVNFLDHMDRKDAQQQAAKIGVEMDVAESWGGVVEAVFAEKVEPTLIQPTHVTEYPKDISPLAKVHPNAPFLVERFETFVNGWEIANAFSELTNPLDQQERFEKQIQQRERGDHEAHPMDEDFITAMEYGLPPTGGLGIGLDRLTMLLTNSSNIRDVILFPTLRPK